ncbi:cupin domain [Ruminococcus sp. CAG:379]|nr:cupin domain [Ruminococcus sp. CAG:379]
MAPYNSGVLYYSCNKNCYIMNGGILMKQYTKITLGADSRTELHDKLGLTGAEVSINTLPAGAGVPFVHAHKQNEEIYGILTGKGKAVIDGEEITLTAGDWLRVAPAAKRQFSAAADSAISYVCIQVKEYSLAGFTQEDAVVE